MGMAKLGSACVVMGRLLAVAAFAAGCLAGCGTMKPAGDDAGAVRTIWKAREQFVTVVSRERGGGIPDVANDHPVTVTPAGIRKALASVRVLAKGEETPAPLFTETELKVLEDAVSAGLRQAGPDDDLTFAVIGYHPTLFGLAKEPKVTAGRIFSQEGRLNLILGVVHRDVGESEDRRLSPLVPGSRLKPSAIAGRIMPTPGGVQFSMKREDWLVFSPAGASAPTVEDAPRTEPVVPAAGEGGGTAPRTPEPQRAGERPASLLKTIEERLLILNDLRDKKLISEEEYRAKRREILGEL